MASQILLCGWRHSLPRYWRHCSDSSLVFLSAIQGGSVLGLSVVSPVVLVLFVLVELYKFMLTFSSGVIAGFSLHPQMCWETLGKREGVPYSSSLWNCGGTIDSRSPYCDLSCAMNIAMKSILSFGTAVTTPVVVVCRGGACQEVSERMTKVPTALALFTMKLWVGALPESKYSVWFGL